MKWFNSSETEAIPLGDIKGTIGHVVERFFHPSVICGEQQQTCNRISDTYKLLSQSLEREEELMHTCGYPEFQKHCKDHAEMLKKLNNMMQTLACNGYDNADVHHRLKDWATRHTVNYDKPFADFWIKKFQTPFKQ